MTMKSLLIVASALALVATTASADAKTRKRHKMPRVVHLERAPAPDPIRERYMLLYGGCVSDEGYGRYSPCGVGSSTFSGR